VRFSGANFAQFAIGRGGAIVDPGDGELILPPILQPVIELPAPLFTLRTPTGTINTPTIFQGVSAAAGVSAGFTTTLMTLATGIWHLDLYFRWMFTGTTNFGLVASLDLTDPGAITRSLFYANFFTGTQISESRSLLLNLAEPGWVLSFGRNAQIAGDASEFFVSVSAQKIL